MKHKTFLMKRKTYCKSSLEKFYESLTPKKFNYNT